MKRLMTAFVLSGSLFMLSCGDSTATGDNTDSSKADAKEVAKDANEQKFDSTDLKGDTDFAVKIADDGMLEVELGKLALKNASSPKVKEFAKMMVDDHSKANMELKTAAEKKNITLPAALSDKCQKKYNDLMSKKGPDFDKAYMSEMVDGHQDVLDEMNKEAENGKDADLRMWAQGKVDVIKHHLEIAKSTKDLVNR